MVKLPFTKGQAIIMQLYIIAKLPCSVKYFFCFRGSISRAFLSRQRRFPGPLRRQYAHSGRRHRTGDVLVLRLSAQPFDAFSLFVAQRLCCPTQSSSVPKRIRTRCTARPAGSIKKTLPCALWRRSAHFRSFQSSLQRIRFRHCPAHHRVIWAQRTAGGRGERPALHPAAVAG